MDRKRLSSHQCVAAALAFVVIGPYSHDPEAAGDPDLTVQIQQVTANPVVTGAHPIIYRVTVRNIEDESASQVLTVVRFPNTFRFETPVASGSDFGCFGPIAITIGGGVSVGCATSQVGAKAQREFTVQAKAPTAIDGASQVFTIIAEVDGNNTIDEEEEGNNTGTVTTTVETRADLTASVSGSATTANAGSNITYVTTLRNIGDRATGSWGIAYLPQQVEWNSDQSDRGAFQSCGLTSFGGQHPGQKILCVGQILPGAQASANIVVKVPSSLANGTTQVQYSVRADPNDLVTERSESNNLAVANTTLISRADLRITGSETHKCRILEGDCFFALTLVVHNDGPGPSRGTILRVSLPAGYVDALARCPDLDEYFAGGVCLAAESGAQGCQVNCALLGIVPGGQSLRLHIGGIAPLNKLGTRLTIPVVVDPSPGTVLETNEINNDLTFTFTQ